MPTPLDALVRCADQSWLQQLTPDPETDKYAPNKSSRQVRSGHYIRVLPTPLPKPKLVTYSRPMAEELHLTEEECLSDTFLAFFSGNQDRVKGLDSWCTPYALAIMGQPMYNNCPFGNGNGYGDGRAISVGEVMIPGSDGRPAKRWEMQLKGSGTTPFCRGADGRAVLRSSIREFIASEAMHNLGVDTTRALSLIVSGLETVSRPWYSGRTDGQGVWDPDTRIQEPCAITTRVATSFLRVGHIDLHARRARATGGDEQRKMHHQMVEHALFREYPDVAPGESLPVRARAMLEAAAERFGRLIAGWWRVGFCQGNFNADNCLVGGRTMDYGPFGWIEKYDPSFAKWVGSGDHFAFMSQASAAVANYGTLVDAVQPAFGVSGSAAIAQDVKRCGSARILALAADIWRLKLGFGGAEDGPEAAAAASLWKDLEPLMRKSSIDYTIFWRQLAVVVEVFLAEGPDQDIADECLMKPLHVAFYTAPNEELVKSWAGWLRRWLSCLRGVHVGARVRVHGIKAKPELNGQFGSVVLWNAPKERWGVRLPDGAEVAFKPSNLEAFTPADLATPSQGDAAEPVAMDDEGVVAVPARLRAVNPKYVPREWMLVEAYEKAGKGDYSVIHELNTLFLAPYSEQLDFESKYFCRAPAAALIKGGCAKMS